MATGTRVSAMKHGAESAGYDATKPLCTTTARFPALRTMHESSLPLWRRYMTLSHEELSARVELRESAEAIFELGRRHELGRGGAEKDYAKAAALFAEAADMGHEESVAKLHALVSLHGSPSGHVPAQRVTPESVVSGSWCAQNRPPARSGAACEWRMRPRSRQRAPFVVSPAHWHTLRFARARSA